MTTTTAQEKKSSEYDEDEETSSPFKTLLSSIPWKELLLAGSLMTLIKWGRSKLQNRGSFIELTPRPEAFDIDRSSYVLFHKLGKLRKNHPTAYEDAIEYTDRILLLEKKLQNKINKPIAGDMIRTKANITHVHLLLLEMQEHCVNASEICFIRSIHAEITRFLTYHFNQISRLCLDLSYQNI